MTSKEQYGAATAAVLALVQQAEQRLPPFAHSLVAQAPQDQVEAFCAEVAKAAVDAAEAAA